VIYFTCMSLEPRYLMILDPSFFNVACLVRLRMHCLCHYMLKGRLMSCVRCVCVCSSDEDNDDGVDAVTGGKIRQNKVYSLPWRSEVATELMHHPAFGTTRSAKTRLSRNSLNIIYHSSLVCIC
jgi:hypothetical protein